MPQDNASRTVSPERTGWRDEKLSERHRLWGWDCPAVDVDFLMVEYDRGDPIALFEYKHEKASAQNSSHSSYRAITRLGTRAKIPVFAARYKSDFSLWNVVALNKIAQEHFERKEMNEIEFVSFLYKLRGRTIPNKVIEELEAHST